MTWRRGEDKVREEEDEVEEGRTQSGGKENREWRKGDEEERSSGDMVEKWWTEEEVQEGREEVEEVLRKMKRNSGGRDEEVEKEGRRIRKTRKKIEKEEQYKRKSKVKGG